MLLDFAVDDVQCGFHSIPIDHAPTLSRLARLDRAAARWSLPCGGAYLIHARKQQSPLTPVKPLLRRMRPRLGAVPLAGGTNVLIDLRSQRLAPKQIMDLGRVPGLRGISVAGGRVTLGLLLDLFLFPRLIKSWKDPE